MPRAHALSEDVTIHGARIPAGSTFYDAEPFDDRVFTLASEGVVHGVRLAPGSTVEVAPFPPPLTVCFTPLLLPLYPWFTWQRYRDVVLGAILGIEPTNAITIGGVEVRAGDRMWLGRAGLVSLMIRSPRTIDGHALETGTVTFAKSGRVREIVLYRSQHVGGVPCFGSGLVGTEIRLDDAGRVRRCVLSEDTALGGVTYARATRLTFDAGGRVVGTKAMRVDVALYSPRPEIAAR